MLDRFQQYMQTYSKDLSKQFEVLSASDKHIRVRRPLDIFEYLLMYHETLTTQLIWVHPEMFVYKQITYLKGKENDISYNFAFPYSDTRNAFVSFDTFSRGAPIKRLKTNSYFLDESYDFVFNERYTETQPADQFKEALLQLSEFRLLYATGLIK